MKCRLIAVTVVAAAALLGVPTMASASAPTHVTNHSVSHVIKTNGPPMCC